VSGSNRRSPGGHGQCVDKMISGRGSPGSAAWRSRPGRRGRRRRPPSGPPASARAHSATRAGSALPDSQVLTAAPAQSASHQPRVTSAAARPEAAHHRSTERQCAASPHPGAAHPSRKRTCPRPTPAGEGRGSASNATKARHAPSTRTR
jgi:hypothetical protein